MSSNNCLMYSGDRMFCSAGNLTGSLEFDFVIPVWRILWHPGRAAIHNWHVRQVDIYGPTALNGLHQTGETPNAKEKKTG